ncbi:hypothetical protein HDU67_006205 [Dinochytrium kinnereticum]|nr:hypothetical protein HDU67_006205 [Dinochytrium kinnereticum]
MSRPHSLLPTSKRDIGRDDLPFQDHPLVRSTSARIHRTCLQAKRHPRAILVIVLVMMYLFGGSFLNWFLGHNLRHRQRMNAVTTPAGTQLAGIPKASPVGDAVKLGQAVPTPAVVDRQELMRSQVLQLEEQLSLERHKVAELQKKMEKSSPPSSDGSTDGGDKIALVAVMTFPGSFQRRAMIRTTCLQLLPPGVDVLFVMGTTRNATTRAMVAMEQRAHKDLVILDTVDETDVQQSGGDSAKAISLFGLTADKMKSPVKATYRFLVKSDDDVFLHLVNLKARLARIEGDRIYFGMPTSTLNAMHDSAYALSWSIIQDLATTQIPKTDLPHRKDTLISLWLTSPDITHVKLYEKESSEIYTDPATAKEDGKKFLTPGTVAVLGLKEEERFWAVSSWFLRHTDGRVKDVAAAQDGKFGGSSAAPSEDKKKEFDAPAPLPAKNDTEPKLAAAGPAKNATEPVVVVGPGAKNDTAPVEKKEGAPAGGEEVKKIPAGAAAMPGPAVPPVPKVAPGVALPPPVMKPEDAA